MRDLSAAPALLTIDEVASFYRCGTSTIYRQLLDGSFRPIPIAVRPYRWRREDIEADIAQRAAAAETLFHERRRQRKTQAPRPAPAPAPKPRRRRRRS
jgi:predicted DNA-binding transcriptional regulator AlpA